MSRPRTNGNGPAAGPTIMVSHANGACCSTPLIRFAALLFARTLPCERLLGAAPITWLQIKRVLLDILDDIFLLHFPFETAQRTFD
jgi:hypothetical protein